MHAKLMSLAFNNITIRVFEDERGFWFVAKDICDILELTNITQALEGHPDDEKGLCNIDTRGGKQTLLSVSEAGLYRLIFKSRKEEAENFRKWVFNEVLPSIRKTGNYTAPNSNNFASTIPKKKITSINKAFNMIPGAIRAAKNMGMNPAEAIIEANKTVLEITGIDVTNLFRLTDQAIETRARLTQNLDDDE